MDWEIIAELLEVKELNGTHTWVWKIDKNGNKSLQWRKPMGYKCIHLEPVTFFLTTQEYYIHCEQQICKLRANRSCLFEPLRVTQSSEAYPEPHLSLPGMRKRRRKEWGSCPPRVAVIGMVCHWGWDGRWYSRNGLFNTPGIQALTHLGSLSSFFFHPGLQDECFPRSSCYWKDGGCLVFLLPVYPHMHSEVHWCNSSA